MTPTLIRVFAATLALCATAPALAQSGKPAPKPPRQELQLDSSTITGSRELPTVLNILPWKRPPGSELPGAPDSTLLNGVIQPVNRVEFRRELRYTQPAGTP